MHRVVKDGGRSRIGASSRIEISPGFLRELLLFFRGRDYEIISLDDLYERLEAGVKGPPFVCFTFDDGYADVHDIIYPIFKRYNAPFAVYMVTSFVEGDAVVWWYILEDLLLETDLPIHFTFRGREYCLDVSSKAKKEQAYNILRQILMELPQEQVSSLLKRIFPQVEINFLDYNSYQISWKKLLEMAKDPLVTIGAHTVNHLNLRKLTRDAVLREVMDSKHILEAKLKGPVHHFAYPFGSKEEAGPREFDLVKRCGFKTAVTMREGAIFPVHRHYTHCLPRVEVTGRHQDLKLIDMRRCGLISLLKNGFRPVVAD